MAAHLLGLWSVLGFGALVLATDWVPWLRSLTGATLGPESWPEAALILAFAPFVFLQVLCIDAETRLNTRPGSEREAARGLALRMFWSALAPLALYLVVLTVVGAVPTLRVLVSEVDLYHALFLVLMLGSMSLALPRLIANAWRTRPLEPGPRRQVLEAVAARANFTCREVRVWQTGNLVPNAAIVGVGRRRLVLITDALLNSLGPRELACVYGHEIGHAKCRHAGTFLAWSLGFFLAADLLAPTDELWGSVFLIASLGLWVVGFGWLSRRSELEADLFSLDLLGDPEALISALGRVGVRSRDRGGWRHFSSSRRMAFIGRVAADPALGARFKSRLRKSALGGVTLLLVAGALELREMASVFARQRTRADLILGHYPDAIRRSAGLDDDSPDLKALAALVSELTERGEVHEDQLRKSLKLDLARGEAQRAAGWATLLALRGDAPAADFVRLMDLLSEGADEGAEVQRLRERLPPSWVSPH